MTRQNTLPGITVGDHSNLGKDWEAQLEAVHEWYRRRRVADIVKNPVEWIYVSQKDYEKCFIENPAQAAQTGDGRFMRRVPSDVDFAGGGKGFGTPFAVCFDAKTTVETARVSLKMFRARQIQRLRFSDRCGVLSGFLLYLSALHRAFWIPLEFISEKEEAHTVSSAGGRRRAKPGTASLTLEEIERNCPEINRNPRNGLWDFLPVILK